ncbi:MAG: DoxX family protein [Elusimicrobia bacterium]|nr:DoxX family protein [Elusimicrobiota bacterium]MBI5882145.1 DoxX family protein [Elusimicrobiota bacterium]
MLDRDSLLAMAGRLLLALVFIASAFGKVTEFEKTVLYMEAHGVPLATLLCVLAALVEAAGGIALVVGYQARLAAASLAVFVTAATVIFHLAPDQRVDLLRNLAIIGGLLQVMAWGPGDISMEGRRS